MSPGYSSWAGEPGRDATGAAALPSLLSLVSVLIVLMLSRSGVPPSTAVSRAPSCGLRGRRRIIPNGGTCGRVFTWGVDRRSAYAPRAFPITLLGKNLEACSWGDGLLGIYRDGDGR